MTVSVIVALMLSFLEVYPHAKDSVLGFIEKNQDEISSSLGELSEDDCLIAISIVAPEISQYSSISDFFEVSSLYAMYMNFGRADFSIGRFQMKPSFVENLEKDVLGNPSLLKKFSNLIPTGSEREKRKFRLGKLSNLSGQLEYLRLFMAIAAEKTSSIVFRDSEEKLKYLSTLYNSGINLNNNQVLNAMNKKRFPRLDREFNYAEVAYEFYKLLKSMPGLSFTGDRNL